MYPVAALLMEQVIFEVRPLEVGHKLLRLQQL